MRVNNRKDKCKNEVIRIESFDDLTIATSSQFYIEKIFIHFFKENYAILSLKFTKPFIDYLKLNFDYDVLRLYQDSKEVYAEHLIFNDFCLYYNLYPKKTLDNSFIAIKLSKKPLAKKLMAKCNEYYEEWLLLDENKATNINVVTQNSIGLDLEELKGKKYSFEEDNYNTNTIKHKNELVELLKINTNGIYFIHGKPGSGKTSLIKSIAHDIDKEFIFFPPSMADAISSPKFIPFLMNHKDSIIIIEDGENIIKSRGTGNNTAVSNLLNISDGILADLLNIQIICTFNTDLGNIDKALLRKGRAKKIIEINELSIDKTNNLLKKLGHDHISNEEMMLTDIYNFEQEVIEKVKTRIGFNR